MATKYTLGTIKVDSWPEQQYRGWANVRVELPDGRFAKAGCWWKAPGADNPCEGVDGSLRNSNGRGGYYGDSAVDMEAYEAGEWGESSPGLEDDEDAVEVIAMASTCKAIRDAIEAYCEKRYPAPSR